MHEEIEAKKERMARILAVIFAGFPSATVLLVWTGDLALPVWGATLSVMYVLLLVVFAKRLFATVLPLAALVRPVWLVVRATYVAVCLMFTLVTVYRGCLFVGLPKWTAWALMALAGFGGVAWLGRMVVRSKELCSYPGCRKPVADDPDGPRYVTPAHEYRRGPGLILLCGGCALMAMARATHEHKWYMQETKRRWPKSAKFPTAS